MELNRDNRLLASWCAVGAITLIALALRITAARGGMWTDEAWSVVFAEKARGPLGVFLRINHDNNHVLNTLWLQAIGPHPAPLLARAPAIVAGTLMAPVAALLFIRRSVIAAVAAASLFAISPIMVVYGSEARGYAPMMLAALILILLTTAAAEGRRSPVTPWMMALIAALGTLAQLTMVAPVVLLSLWIFMEKRLSSDLRTAVWHTAKLMGPSVAASATAVLLVTVPAMLSPTGLQTGGYNRFTTGNYALGIANLETWAVGWTFSAHWLAPFTLFGIGAAMILRSNALDPSRRRMYGILILGVPVVILAERFGNTQFSRFYLCSAIALLLLGAEWIGQAVKGGRVNAALCGTAGLLFLVTAGWRDWRFITLERGQPERAIQLMAEQAPDGAAVYVPVHQFVAPVELAAQQAGYPVALTERCGPVRFMFVQRQANSSGTVMACGRAMHAIGWSDVTDLTGDAWVLYRA